MVLLELELVGRVLEAVKEDLAIRLHLVKVEVELKEGIPR